jgi:glycosyltransferase involved in cell wall biosynthesis
MRVLMITPRCSETAGGDGLYAHHLANACRDLRVDTHVLTVRDNRFVHIEWSRQSDCNRPEDGRFVHNLGQVDQDVFRLNYYSGTAGRSIASSIKSVRPDLIHVHGLHQIFTLAAISHLKSFIGPIILTVHDYKLLCGNASFFSDRANVPCFRCLDGAYLPPLRERCKKGSLVSSFGVSVQMGLWKQMRGLDTIDFFHCGSEFVFNLLSQNASIANRLAKVRLPLLHHPGSAVRRDAEKVLKLAYVGRMVPHKGPIVFAQAVQGFRVPIKIYGDGPLMSSMSSLLSSNRQVDFRGWVSHQMGPMVY